VFKSWILGLTAGMAALGLLVAYTAYSRGADSPLAGAYKVTIIQGDTETSPWIVKVGGAAEHPTVEVVTTLADFPDAKATAVHGDATSLHFTLSGPGLTLEVAAYSTKGDRALLGAWKTRGQYEPLRLDPTTKTSLEPKDAGVKSPGFDELEKAVAAGGKVDEAIAKVVADHPGKPVVFAAYRRLWQSKIQGKATEAELKAAAEKLLAASTPYGRELLASATTFVARGLSTVDMRPLALEYARKAAAFAADDDPPQRVIALIKPLAAALKKSGKEAEAAAVDARIAKLDAVLDAEFLKTAVPFKVEKVPARKKDGARVVAVELFTGAQCPPCVAADIAFTAVSEAFDPSDVVLLQYHLHVPGPDPMTCPDSEERAAYYRVRGTPTMLVDGQDEGAGSYKDVRKKIDERLDEDAGAQLTATATKDGDSWKVTADVGTTLKNSDGKLRVRFVLAEEVIRYAAANGQRFHHHVVRAMPGGVAGFPLTGEKTVQSVTIKRAEIVKALEQYLALANKERPFPDDDRPLDLKKLKVVVLVQDDDNREILQAAQLDLADKE
jgi:hypothetical protein